WLPGVNRGTIEALRFVINRADVYPCIGLAFLSSPRVRGSRGDAMRASLLPAIAVPTGFPVRRPSVVAHWIPAFAGMTRCCDLPRRARSRLRADKPGPLDAVRHYRVICIQESDMDRANTRQRGNMKASVTAHREYTISKIDDRVYGA